jgi:hypothetical protein
LKRGAFVLVLQCKLGNFFKAKKNDAEKMLKGQLRQISSLGWTWREGGTSYLKPGNGALRLSKWFTRYGQSVRFIIKRRWVAVTSTLSVP